MWISVLPGVLLVIVQAIVLSRRAIVSGRKMGITERQFKSAIRSSALWPQFHSSLIHCNWNDCFTQLHGRPYCLDAISLYWRCQL
ncbi:MAG: DUF5058 family protein [Oscillospiraceae bacterium]